MHGLAHGGTTATPGLTGPGGTQRRTPPSLVAAAYTPCGSRTRVTVLGELDFDSARALWPGLQEALAGASAGLDFDLGGVDFCDCAGFNFLLDLRRQALGQGKTVALHAVSPAVDRLLTLIGARELFTAPPPHCADGPLPADAEHAPVLLRSRADAG
ncbi:STAS domain-containing protein [Streptomyces sp. NPDC017248]|uniref:STAS domain-containing protein n=1 Tax=unclassified Streptomyces TaxID=2593676 RepID=UPI0037BC03BA